MFLFRFKPYPKYKGNATEICEQIVQKCWNGKFFQTGACSYPLFWTRDFAFCTNALMSLGYKKEVHKTLNFALNHFQKQNKVGCYINRYGKVMNFPIYAVDTLPLLLYSIDTANFNIKPYKDFLNQEIQGFYKKVFNAKKGIIKEYTHFSSMKDHFIKNSSCYDNCMIALLCKEVTKLKLENPFKKYNFKKIITKHFWNGYYFNEDLTNAEVTGDANIFPFWTSVITGKKMFKSCLGYIQTEKLDKPFPLKYTKENHNGQIAASIFVPTWEGDKIWPFLGLYFIEILIRFNKPLAQQYLNLYKEQIEKNQNFYELFTKKGEVYKSLFYKADHSMLWASKYLYLDSFK